MSSNRLFGTDGVRGVAGEYPLDPITISALGTAVGSWLAEQSSNPSIVVGGDTRASTEDILALLQSALERCGVAVRNAGVIPTPGVARLVTDFSAGAGIVVSASHNPYTDNGIKLISADGSKLTRQAEEDIEHRALAAIERTIPQSSPLTTDISLLDHYRDTLCQALPAGSLAGLTIVLDTANGAAAPIAEQVFSSYGANVQTIADAPNGININRGCGSTDTGKLQQAVVDAGADLGIAFDGDADRAVLVDERGNTRDGDAILFLWATALTRQSQLDPPKIVATSMSNLGLEQALAARGISMIRCDVGDRAVVETLRSEGLTLGGEQSGHIVDLSTASTGDGILTGLRVASILAALRLRLSEALADLKRLPQLIANVRVGVRIPINEVEPLATVIEQVHQQLGDRGRLVIRYSGTEPLLRIMIEGEEQSEIEALAESIAVVARRQLPESQTELVETPS